MKKFFRNIVLMMFFCGVVLPDYFGIAATESSEIIATEPSEEEYDVRKVRWGMNIEEIQKSEKSIINRFPEKKRPKGVQYNTIQYIDTIFNTKCYVTYWYDLNKGLNDVSYTFQSNSYEDAEKIFSTLKQTLSTKYTIMAEFYKNAPYDYVCFNERTVVDLSIEGKRIFLSYYEKSHWYNLKKAAEEFKNKNKANITNADTSQF